MSDVISRPSASRGRGSGRGGRGGFAGRGGRRTNGDKADHKAGDDAAAAFEDEGEFAELRKKYGDKTSVICEMFPDWSEVDVLYVLQETNGDQAEAVTRIAEGTVSQWGEVSKPKKTARPKAKDTPAPSNPDPSAPRTARGGRNATEAGRGRGRAVDRGGRGGRGRSAGPATNGSRTKENQPLSVPTEESSAYKEGKTIDNTSEEKPAIQVAALVEPPKPAVKTWASMLRQSTAPKPPAPAPPKEPPAPKPVESVAIKTEPDFELVPIEDDRETFEPEPEVDLVDEAAVDVEATPVAGHATPDAPSSSSAAEPTIELPTSQDELTTTNLQQVADDSKPPTTDTAASTAADSWDPRQSPLPSAVIPLSASQQQAQRAAASGYAATALKATGGRTALRASTMTRRVLDQEEAVRMPGNREVDRAAVQFGAFNLGETDEDIDGEREEPETRAQPPADSPIAHPRTSLPPASQPVAVPEIIPQKPLTTAPPPGMAPAAASNLPASTSFQSVQPLPHTTTHLGRFGQAAPQDLQAAQPKPLDHVNQQTTTASQPPFDTFANQTSQLQAQQPGVAFSSAPGDYSAYYTANQPDRPYNIYGQHYGQQGGHGQPELSQQRPYVGYNASQNDSLSQYPQSGVGLNQPRFGATTESQNSGHSTPNPPSQTQQQAQQQQQQPQQQGAPPSQPQTHGQYPGYSHPYQTHPNYYYQYYSGYSQFGPYGKGGMYGQPYGVSPNAPYDHASSSGAFGPSSVVHRDSPLTSGLGDYGRAGAGQANNQPGLGGSSFGGTHESFRGSHAFQSQGQAYNTQAQPGAGTSADELKPFSDAKSGSGPSPSLGGPRPGSATNTGPGGQSGSMPPQQSSQVSGVYGVYPGQQHLQGHGLHGSGAYGMGGGAGSQHSTPHGSYGQGGFGTGYYGAGQQQQGQQQRGGWGGNYH